VYGKITELIYPPPNVTFRMERTNEYKTLIWKAKGDYL
jgi:hypothetical protein